MRWLFLLLVVLNAVYYVWHQQEAPLKAKEVAPLSLYKGSQQGIRLLSESGAGGRSAQQAEDCLYIGGLAKVEQLNALRQRLVSLDVATAQVVGALGDSPGFWLQVAPQSRRLLDEALLATLSHDFKDLKHKIMLCEGIATAE
ncbi:hypothetical protein CYD26_02525 [Pseudomonas sp. FFUP_PS_473]|jgi:hypothetical protein|uniref:hypothetical protein n=1 Tax=Pseudomonas TaxID=286 RepID=UPI000C7E6935|nr:hypothetical protein [Pseudomonas sp. FFUP_PS_473]MEE3634669.1 hypothetical protein [Pseudomonas sp. AL 58]PLP95920.1 hypothetical protein CYD26_02525 [Pseudomonas sp. FFUP_PS_473]WJM97034.1 hypothetical protein QEP73_02585 [Pseudomonas defluvii]